MVTIYHKSIQNTLIDYAKNLKKNKKIREFFEGNRRPLSITDSKSKSVVNYQPDIYFILKNNKKLIIEILDSEEKKQDIIIADIIRSILVENVEGIIFIYSGEKKVENSIFESLKTIYKGLVDLGISLDNLPGQKFTGPYAISRSQANKKSLILKKLNEYFPF